MWQFRELQSSWGIAIDIAFEAATELPQEGLFEEVYPNIFLSRDVHLSERELEFFQAGVRRITTSLRESQLVVFSSIKYAACDYQEEGLEWAIAFALSDFLDVPRPAVTIRFDKKSNRYLFYPGETSIPGQANEVD